MCSFVLTSLLMAHRNTNLSYTCHYTDIHCILQPLIYSFISGFICHFFDCIRPSTCRTYHSNINKSGYAKTFTFFSILNQIYHKIRRCFLDVLLECLWCLGCSNFRMLENKGKTAPPLEINCNNPWQEINQEDGLGWRENRTPLSYSSCQYSAWIAGLDEKKVSWIDVHSHMGIWNMLHNLWLLTVLHIHRGCWYFSHLCWAPDYASL